MVFRIFLFCFALILWAKEPISLGIDTFFEDAIDQKYTGKKVGIIMNHTSVDREMVSTLNRFRKKMDVCAIFTPEHGLKGQHHAWDKVAHGKEQGIPVYSLHGETRRPTAEMLKGIDLLVYDIQCTGVRAYTYATTLFYVMEEAAKLKIPVVVLDRPNPINGLTVDGPMLEDAWRSFIGYVNVPYCHGMTIGELSWLFNEEYHIGCKLEVVPMKGWKRSMSYRDTGLAWIPPSPNVPEADTPLYCPMTGIVGELQLVNIGIGFSLPFKVVGAPWIQSELFANKLNQQKLPGVHFQPFHFRPFWGLYKGENCEGVLIQVTDYKIYRPIAVQYLILGLLKSLYPKEFEARVVEGKTTRKDLFCKANGSAAIYDILFKEKYPAWPLIQFHKAEREAFLEKRKKYLLQYAEY